MDNLEILPKQVNQTLSQPLIFSLIVLFQGLMGGSAFKAPSILTDTDEILSSPAVRFLYITAIAFTATQKLETAMLSSALFLLLMHLLRDDDEKKDGMIW